MPKLLFLVNVDWFFLSHRLPIALAAKKMGYEVHVAVEITDRYDELLAHGFNVHRIIASRTSYGVLNDLRHIIEYVSLLKSVQPDIVHLVTLRPVLFGALAARLVGVQAVVMAISGLGSVFLGASFVAKLRRRLVELGLLAALGHRNKRVIFQNDSDLDLFCRRFGLLDDEFEVIPGSGVDLGHYAPAPMPEGGMVFLMGARLIIEKGVLEFAEAARIVRNVREDVRFLLAGVIDNGNPRSLSQQQVEELRVSGVVELLGERSDMASVLKGSHVVVLPSYYGEGLPKILIEAAASGRAIVTTDWPGCRDAILPNKTGLLVPTRDSNALSEAFLTLIDDPELVEKMGHRGRELAKLHFNIEDVVGIHLQIYRDLLGQ